LSNAETPKIMKHVGFHINTFDLLFLGVLFSSRPRTFIFALTVML